MKKTPSLLLALIFLLLTASCQVELINDTEIQPEGEDTSRLLLTFKNIPGSYKDLSSSDKDSTSSRSAVMPDEKTVEEVLVMFYSGGHLVTSTTSESYDDIEMELRVGTYNIYVVANMPGFEAPINEADLNDQAYEITSIGNINENLPMSWSGSVQLKSGEKVTSVIILERLVSRIQFSVDPGVLEGLKITSVRLYQGAKVLRPFMEGGSRILKPDESIAGDYATESDLERLNNGRALRLYALENCQGNLLPDNVDPWEKIPTNLGDAAKLCSYIEMKCVWTADADYEGEVTYRFYLGEDATSDFDIKRNSIQILKLYLNESSLDKMCWKIDTSQMELTKWEVTSDFSKNFHKQDNFYATECIRIDLQLDDAAIKYWEKRDFDFSLAGIDKDGNTILSFRTPVEKANNGYYAIGTCLTEGDFEVVMINNETGDAVYSLNTGTIKTPGVVIGPDGIYDDEKVESISSSLDFIINKDSMDLYLYLVDSDGYNLNQGHYYGCDLDVCDWELDIINNEYDYSISNGATITSEVGVSESDSYAMKYTLSFENNGVDNRWNKRLIGSLGKDVLTLEFKELTSAASITTPIGLGCEDISVTMKPTTLTAKAEFGTEFMYVVTNSSKLPFDITGIKENSMYSIPDDKGILWDFISGTINNYTSSYPLVISKMKKTRCGFDSTSAKSIENGDEIWYAAYDDDVDQSKIPNQLSLFHVLKAEMSYQTENHPTIIGEQILDGTSAHITKYGNSGYRNVGMKFFSGDNLYEDYNSYDNLYTDFKYYGDMQEKENIDKVNDVIEITLSINENHQIIATATENIEVILSLEGTLSGHIRCVTSKDPFDTVWGCYFKEDVDFNSSGTYTIGTSPIVIDNSTLSAALTKLREIPFYSAYDLSKEEDFRDPGYYGSSTIREYLKPYGISLKVNIVPNGDQYAAVRFDGNLSYDYQSSDPITWDGLWMSAITMVPSSYSGFDDKLDDDGCPAGEVFKEEVVEIVPKMEYVKKHDIFYVSGE